MSNTKTNVKTYTIKKSDIMALKTACNYYSDDDFGKAIEGVLITKDQFVFATDGYVMYRDKVQFQLDNDIVLFGRDLKRAIKELGKLNPEITLFVYDTYVTFGSHGDRISIIDKSYPTMVPFKNIEAELNHHITFDKFKIPNDADADIIQITNTNVILYKIVGREEMLGNIDMNFESDVDFSLCFSGYLLQRVLKTVRGNQVTIHLSDRKYGGMMVGNIIFIANNTYLENYINYINVKEVK